jgi:hypothetical protein
VVVVLVVLVVLVVVALPPAPPAALVEVVVVLLPPAPPVPVAVVPLLDAVVPELVPLELPEPPQWRRPARESRARSEGEAWARGERDIEGPPSASPPRRIAIVEARAGLR